MNWVKNNICYNREAACEGKQPVLYWVVYPYMKQHDETRREYMTLAMELKRMFSEGAKDKETMMILEML